MSTFSPGAKWRRLKDIAQTALQMQGKPAWHLPFTVADILWLRWRREILLDEYTSCRFWENRREKLDHHVTDTYQHWFVRHMNETDACYLLADKRILLQRIGPALGRQYWELDRITAEDFIQIVSCRDKLIAKPPGGSQGKGIRVLDGRLGAEDALVLYRQLLEEGCTLLEEYIQQNDVLNRLYPGAVSVLKIHTFRLEGKSAVILYPMLFIGSAGAKISTFNFVPLGIDRQSGALDPVSTNGHREHPDTHCRFEGVVLPYYQEAEQLALSLSELMPEPYYVCWDIAIGTEGPVVMEGNGWPRSDYFMQLVAYQRTGLGTKEIYERMIRDVEQYRK